MTSPTDMWDTARTTSAHATPDDHIVTAAPATVGAEAHAAKQTIRDQLLEDALTAAKRFATSLGNSDHAGEAWRITYRLKALRRPEVVARLDAEMLRRVTSGASQS